MSTKEMEDKKKRKEKKPQIRTKDTPTPSIRNEIFPKTRKPKNLRSFFTQRYPSK